MRFYEFKNINALRKLVEADDEEVDTDTISQSKMALGNLYPRGGEVKYIQSIAKSIEKGNTFVFTDKKDYVIGKITDIKVDEKSLSPDEWMNWASNPDVDKKAVMKTKFVVNGKELTPNKMHKTDAVTGVSINVGDFAEAVLGCSLTAKYYRGGSNIKADDVVSIMKDVITQRKVTLETNYNESGVKEDKINFFLTLNKGATAGIRAWMREVDPMDSDVESFYIVEKKGADPELIKKLQKVIKDGVAYANTSKQVEIAVKKAKTDPKRNTVRIISDGGDASQQNITKVDLKIVIDKTPLRLLSLKAGTVGQFGQVSGGTWDSVKRFIDTTLKIDLPDNLKSEFGFEDPEDSKDNSYLKHNYAEGPFSKLYDYVEKQIKEYTEGDNTRKEYNLVQIVYDAINYHATKNEAGVTMVILSPSAKIAYKELAFDTRLLKALELYDLKVVNNVGGKNHQIEVYGTLLGNQAKKELGKNAAKLDKKAKLFQLRSAAQAGAIRNVIEMGPLLKELANIEHLDKQDAPQAEPEQKEPQQQEPQQQEPKAEPQQQGSQDDQKDRSF